MDVAGGWNETNQKEEPDFVDYIVAVTIRGKDTDHLNLTAIGYRMIDEEAFTFEDIDPRVGFQNKNQFKSVNFRISQALDVFSHEVQQKDLTYYTDSHPSNQVVSLFGAYFMALDWDYDKDRLYGFESFTDKDIYIDHLAALPDNSKVLLYNSQKRKLFSLSRQKANQNGQFDRVYERWHEIKIKSNLKQKEDPLAKLRDNMDDLDLFDELAY